MEECKCELSFMEDVGVFDGMLQSAACWEVKVQTKV